MAIGKKQFQECEDNDLVRAMRQGSQEAFEILVVRYHGVILALVSRFMRNPSAARDVAQEVFLDLWTGKERYESQGSFRSYLCSMTVHRCLNLVRREKLHMQKMPQLAQVERQRDTQADLPLHNLLRTEQSEMLWEKMLKLPVQMRETLILRYLHDMQLEEIATLRGLPLGTVKSHLSRGIKKMFSLFTQEKK